jgi:hypothetical protein
MTIGARTKARHPRKAGLHSLSDNLREVEERLKRNMASGA